MAANIFNIRVYGILLNDQNELLVTDEYRFKKFITKFPGGGLNFGEGTVDCLKREMLEETGSEMNVIDHFYTTDFFQVSAFDSSQQMISIYYLIQPVRSLTLVIKEKPFDFDSLSDGAQIFRWVALAGLKENDFTFPIDRQVAALLKKFR